MATERGNARKNKQDEFYTKLIDIENELISVHLPTMKKDKFTNTKKVFVHFVKRNTAPKYIMNLQKWKPITSLHGVKAEKQTLKTVKCFAKNIIEENRTNKVFAP